MHDPRNEVFLSALDLFTLLLFAFAGVWRVTGRANTTEALLLPMVREDTPTVSTVPDETTIAWGGDALRGADGARCTLLFRDEGRTEESFHVPCWPSAFSVSKLAPDPRLKVRAEGRRVLATCLPGQAGLEPCARLVLVAREHGIDALVPVSTP